MKKALSRHCLEAIKESRRRLEVIRAKEGNLGPRVNFGYFLGILRNVDKEIKIRKSDEKARERERRITEDMERIYRRSPQGFSWEIVRIKRYLEASRDNHKAEDLRFIEDTASSDCR